MYVVDSFRRPFIVRVFTLYYEVWFILYRQYLFLLVAVTDAPIEEKTVNPCGAVLLDIGGRLSSWKILWIAPGLSSQYFAAAVAAAQSSNIISRATTNVGSVVAALSDLMA